MDPQITASELTTDPQRLFAGLTTTEEKVAKFNEVPAAPEPGRQRAREVVVSHLVLGAIDPGELETLSADADKSRMLWGLLGMGEINVRDTNTRLILRNIFLPGSTTRRNLATLQNEAISRWVFLGGSGQVYAGDIERAELI